MRKNLFWLSDEQWKRIEPHLPRWLWHWDWRNVEGRKDATGHCGSLEPR